MTRLVDLAGHESASEDEKARLSGRGKAISDALYGVMIASRAHAPDDIVLMSALVAAVTFAKLRDLPITDMMARLDEVVAPIADKIFAKKP